VLEQIPVQAPEMLVGRGDGSIPLGDEDPELPAMLMATQGYEAEMKKIAWPEMWPGKMI